MKSLPVVVLLCLLISFCEGLLSPYNAFHKKIGFRTLQPRKGTFCRIHDLDGEREHKGSLNPLVCRASTFSVNIEPYQLMILISIVGALETGLLSYNKIFDIPVSTALCGVNSASRCMDVLSSPYSMVPIIQFPLVLLAFICYISVGTLSFQGMLNMKQSRASDSYPFSIDPNLLSDILLFLTTSMGTFSVYLMLLLIFVLKQQCNYCYLSALCSFSLAGISWFGETGRNISSKAKKETVGMASVSLTMMSSAFLFYLSSIATPGLTQTAEASTAPAAQAMIAAETTKDEKTFGKTVTRNSKGRETIPSTARTSEMATDLSRNDDKAFFSAPKVDKPSSTLALDIGNRLEKKGAKMYGAYWCSHCNNQKQNLGKVVVDKKQFTYIECDKQGMNSQYNLCRNNNKVPGYPTWEIDGDFFPGEKSLEELQKILDKLDYS